MKGESDSALLARIDERTTNTADHVKKIRDDLDTKYVTKSELELVKKEFEPTNNMFQEIIKYTIFLVIGASLVLVL